MRTHIHPPPPLLRVAVSSLLAGVSLVCVATRSPLHAQPSSPPACTIVAERSLTTPNVVWGLWAPDRREYACDADSPDGGDSTNCNVVGVDLAWFWESAELPDFSAIGECCDACADAPEADDEPARGTAGRPAPDSTSTRSSLLEP